MSRALSKASLSKAYKGLFTEVSAILFRHDPVGISGGGNTDEYDPEAGTILPRLRPGLSTEEVAGIVREEFIRWFGAEASASPETYLPMAGEIRAAYERWLGTR